MLQRTIDKMRAKLPGGNLGPYTIRGSTNVLPGLSLVLLDGIGVTDEQLFEIVAWAYSENDVGQWLLQNADLSHIDSLNQKLLGRRIEDIAAVVPMETLTKVYPFIQAMPKSTPTFDVILEDDRQMFPNHF